MKRLLLALLLCPVAFAQTVTSNQIVLRCVASSRLSGATETVIYRKCSDGKNYVSTAGGAFVEMATGEGEAGPGTVVSVGFSAPAIFSVAGSPIVDTGTIAVTLQTQTANLIWAGPASGAAATPTFRVLVMDDLPGEVARTDVDNSWPGTQTFDDLTVTGTCTGCTTMPATVAYTDVANEFTAAQTFDDIEITGTCTGCPSAAGWSPLAKALAHRRDFSSWYAPAGTAALTGYAADQFTGTAGSNIQDASGSWKALATAASTNATASVFATSTNIAWRPDQRPVLLFATRLPTSITNFRFWVGMFSGSPTGSDTPALHLAAMRYSPATDTDGDWRACTSDASTITCTDTNVPFAFNTAYNVVIDGSTAGTYDFYLNGTLVATNTANLPAETTTMSTYMQLTTLDAVAKTVHFSKFYLSVF